MRKIVLFFAALFFMAVPVMAVTDVNIYCTPEGNAVTVSYQSSNPGNLVRAFALDINVVPEDVNIKKVDVVDPCVYRIFPGQIDIVAGEVASYNTPYATADLNDANVTIEMGSLYTFDTNYIGDVNAGYGKQPGRSGNLFKFYVNKSCHYKVDVNAFRGGIVMEDPDETPNTNLPREGDVVLGCIVPNIVGDTNAVAKGKVQAAGLVWNQIDVNGGAATINTVVSQKPTDGGNIVDCGSTVDANVATYCLDASIAPAAEYNDWVAWGKPSCWCYKRQCYGDADGKKVLYWVATADLNLVKTTYNKADTVLKNIPNGICADFTHTKVLYRVSTADLNIMKTYYNKAETIVPCNDLDKNCILTTADKYNFWTN
jgi:hypothetical protein